MDKPRTPDERDTRRRRGQPSRARPSLGGGGGMLPGGEPGPDVVGTDAAIARAEELPEEVPGESPDFERSPGRGGWQF